MAVTVTVTVTVVLFRQRQPVPNAVVGTDPGYTTVAVIRFRSQLVYSDLAFCFAPYSLLLTPVSTATW